VVLRSSRARTTPRLALWLLTTLTIAQTALAAANPASFSPQRRVGYTAGDQWEPALSADAHGHIYILFPQYGPVSDCAGCTIPTMSLLVSNDNGLTWEAPHSIAPSATGQFDPQIVVDPIDRQTVYASWLQDNKRDVVVARSQDFGHNWYFSVAARSPDDDADKPTLTVHGADVYVGFNHEQNFLVAASHDYAQTFSTAVVNPGADPGSSLAGGATVDPSGNVYFSWTAYAKQESTSHPVSLYVSRSADLGNSWNTVLLDTSGAPPDCSAQGCEDGYLGAQAALTSDAAGTLYALWNSGATNGGPERIYFSSSTTGGASWSARVDVSSAAGLVEHCFPAITAGAAGDVRIAWMDTRNQPLPSQPLWNVFQRSSSNGGATWSLETQLSGPVGGYDYILPNGFRFPFGDYFSIAIDNLGNTNAVWGEGRNFKAPGSIWYTRGH
jgi:hypothetical protein